MKRHLSRRTYLKRSLSSLAGAAAAGRAGSVFAETPRNCPSAKDTLGLLAQGKKIPIIFDTDIGGDIDDTWALLMALQCPELDIKLVSTDQGDTVSRARLAAKLLEACGRADIPVGVGVHPDNPRRGLNQIKWVGDYALENYPGEVHEDGVDAIIKTIHASPDPVTVVAIGPVPNIAEALKRDPSIVNKARFVGMHGSIRVGYGGKSEPNPEANVRNDPKALAAVFAAPWECTITPLDTCGIVKLKGEKHRRVVQRDSAVTRALMENYRVWIPAAKWIKQKLDPDVESSTLFDTVAVYLAFAEELVEMEDLPIRVTDEGMTVIDESMRSVRCAMGWKDLGAFEDLLVERLVK